MYKCDTYMNFVVTSLNRILITVSVTQRRPGGLVTAGAQSYSSIAYSNLSHSMASTKFCREKASGNV